MKLYIAFFLFIYFFHFQMQKLYFSKLSYFIWRHIFLFYFHTIYKYFYILYVYAFVSKFNLKGLIYSIDLFYKNLYYFIKFI